MTGSRVHPVPGTGALARLASRRTVRRALLVGAAVAGFWLVGSCAHQDSARAETQPLPLAAVHQAGGTSHPAAGAHRVSAERNRVMPTVLPRIGATVTRASVTSSPRIGVQGTLQRVIGTVQPVLASARQATGIGSPVAATVGTLTTTVQSVPPDVGRVTGAVQPVPGTIGQLTGTVRRVVVAVLPPVPSPVPPVSLPIATAPTPEPPVLSSSPAGSQRTTESSSTAAQAMGRPRHAASAGREQARPAYRSASLALPGERTGWPAARPADCPVAARSQVVAGPASGQTLGSAVVDPNRGPVPVPDPGQPAGPGVAPAGCAGPSAGDDELAYLAIPLLDRQPQLTRSAAARMSPSRAPRELASTPPVSPD